MASRSALLERLFPRREAEGQQSQPKGRQKA